MKTQVVLVFVLGLTCGCSDKKGVCQTSFATNVFDESQISANGATTCQIHAGGLYCWGTGVPSLGTIKVPQIVGNLEGKPRAVRIFDGFLTTGTACAIVDCSIKCWGWNSNGQVGNGSTDTLQIPTNVSVLGVGMYTSLGANGGGISIHSCTVLNGSAFCWGYNANGQLGIGSTVEYHVPVQVTSLGSSVQSISAGQSHTCAVVSSSAKCWGDNSHGQLGDNLASGTQSTTPIQVQGLQSGVQAIAAGPDHSCAIASGSVWCWGDNSSGAVGVGVGGQYNVPTQVSGTSGATVITVSGDGAGHNISCAIVNGGVKCWGSNTNGQMGMGSTGGSQGTPVTVGSLSNATAITAGANMACAIAGGTTYCWGQNNLGQLGNNTTADYNIPIAVSF